MTKDTLLRTRIEPGGELVLVRVLVCECKARDSRDREGDVCRNCCGAIPDEGERDTLAWRHMHDSARAW